MRFQYFRFPIFVTINSVKNGNRGDLKFPLKNRYTNNFLTWQNVHDNSRCTVIILITIHKLLSDQD